MKAIANVAIFVASILGVLLMKYLQTQEALGVGGKSLGAGTGNSTKLTNNPHSLALQVYGLTYTFEFPSKLSSNAHATACCLGYNLTLCERGADPMLSFYKFLYEIVEVCVSILVLITYMWSTYWIGKRWLRIGGAGTLFQYFVSMSAAIVVSLPLFIRVAGGSYEAYYVLYLALIVRFFTYASIVSPLSAFLITVSSYSFYGEHHTLLVFTLYLLSPMHWTVKLLGVYCLDVVYVNGFPAIMLLVSAYAPYSIYRYYFTDDDQLIVQGRRGIKQQFKRRQFFNSSSPNGGKDTHHDYEDDASADFRQQVIDTAIFEQDRFNVKGVMNFLTTVSCILDGRELPDSMTHEEWLESKRISQKLAEDYFHGDIRYDQYLAGVQAIDEDPRWQCLQTQSRMTRQFNSWLNATRKATAMVLEITSGRPRQVITYQSAVASSNIPTAVYEKWDPKKLAQLLRDDTLSVFPVILELDSPIIKTVRDKDLFNEWFSVEYRGDGTKRVFPRYVPETNEDKDQCANAFFSAQYENDEVDKFLSNAKSKIDYYALTRSNILKITRATQERLVPQSLNVPTIKNVTMRMQTKFLDDNSNTIISHFTVFNVIRPDANGKYRVIPKHAFAVPGELNMLGVPKDTDTERKLFNRMFADSDVCTCRKPNAIVISPRHFFVPIYTNEQAYYASTKRVKEPVYMVTPDKISPSVDPPHYNSTSGLFEARYYSLDGDSGAPIVDKQGNCIGIHEGYYKVSDMSTYAPIIEIDTVIMNTQSFLRGVRPDKSAKATEPANTLADRVPFRPPNDVQTTRKAVERLINGRSHTKNDQVKAHMNKIMDGYYNSKHYVSDRLRYEAFVNDPEDFFNNQFMAISKNLNPKATTGAYYKGTSVPFTNGDLKTPEQLRTVYDDMILLMTDPSTVHTHLMAVHLKSDNYTTKKLMTENYRSIQVPQVAVQMAQRVFYAGLTDYIYSLPEASVFNNPNSLYDWDKSLPRSYVNRCRKGKEFLSVSFDYTAFDGTASVEDWTILYSSPHLPDNVIANLIMHLTASDLATGTGEIIERLSAGGNPSGNYHTTVMNVFKNVAIFRAFSEELKAKGLGAFDPADDVKVCGDDSILLLDLPTTDVGIYIKEVEKCFQEFNRTMDIDTKLEGSMICKKANHFTTSVFLCVHSYCVTFGASCFVGNFVGNTSRRVSSVTLESTKEQMMGIFVSLLMTFWTFDHYPSAIASVPSAYPEAAVLFRKRCVELYGTDLPSVESVTMPMMPQYKPQANQVVLNQTTIPFMIAEPDEEVYQRQIALLEQEIEEQNARMDEVYTALDETRRQLRVVSDFNLVLQEQNSGERDRFYENIILEVRRDLSVSREEVDELISSNETLRSRLDESEELNEELTRRMNSNFLMSTYWALADENRILRELQNQNRTVPTNNRTGFANTTASVAHLLRQLSAQRDRMADLDSEIGLLQNENNDLHDEISDLNERLQLQSDHNLELLQRNARIEQYYQARDNARNGNTTRNASYHPQADTLAVASTPKQFDCSIWIIFVLLFMAAIGGFYKDSLIITDLTNKYNALANRTNTLLIEKYRSVCVSVYDDTPNEFVGNIYVRSYRSFSYPANQQCVSCFSSAIDDFSQNQTIEFDAQVMERKKIERRVASAGITNRTEANAEIRRRLEQARLSKQSKTRVRTQRPPRKVERKSVRNEDVKIVERRVIKRVDEPRNDSFMYQAYLNRALSTRIAPQPINTPVYAPQRYKVAQCRAFRNVQLPAGKTAVIVQTPFSTQAFRTLILNNGVNLSAVQYPASHDDITAPLPAGASEVSTVYFGSLGPTNLAFDNTAGSISETNAKIQPMSGMLQVEATTTINGACQVTAVGPDDYVNNFGPKGTSHRLQKNSSTSENCNHVEYIFPSNYAGTGGFAVDAMAVDFPAKVIGGNSRTTAYVPYYNTQGQWVQPTITGLTPDTAGNYAAGRTPDQAGASIRAGAGWILVKNTGTDPVSLVIKSVAIVAITLGQGNPMILDAPTTVNFSPEGQPMGFARIKVNQGVPEYVGAAGTGFLTCEHGDCVLQPVVRADHMARFQEVSGGTNGFIESVDHDSFSSNLYRIISENAGPMLRGMREAYQAYVRGTSGSAYDGSGQRRLEL